MKWVQKASKSAALYVPFGVLRGGERLLLSVVSSLQLQGYALHLLTDEDTRLKTKNMVLAMAERLRIHIAAGKLDYFLTGSADGRIRAPMEQYDVFFLFGNHIIPQQLGLGLLNIYFCRPPFISDESPRQASIRVLSGYQHVLLESELSLQHYVERALPALTGTLRAHKAMPQVTVLRPPVPLAPESLSGGVLQVSERRDVFLVGSFSGGRQSKGHFEALQVWGRISGCVPRGSRLHIIGAVAQGQEPLLQKLRDQIRSAELSVDLHLDAPQGEIESVISRSLVQWHLTSASGVDGGAGTAVIEGMSAGAVPVVLDGAGMRHIIEHNVTGYLAASLEEVAAHTCHVFGRTPSRLFRMMVSARESAKKFGAEEFSHQLFATVHRGMLSIPLNFFLKHTWDVVTCRELALPASPSKMALIMEFRLDFRLQYVVKNVMYHLGPDWGLTVVHGITNHEFVRRELATVKGAKLVKLDVHSVDIADLNRMMLSSRFWREIGADKVLVFQTDSLLLHSKINQFLDYDYVGAPWAVANDLWKKPPWVSLLYNGVGNGGLSLRTVPVMRSLLEGPGSSPCPVFQEDVTLACMVENSAEYEVAPRSAAYRFAVEVLCDDIHQGEKEPGAANLTHFSFVPLGIHAVWYYLVSPSMFSDLKALLDMSVCGPA